MIAEHKDALEKIAQALLEYETIEGKHVLGQAKTGSGKTAAFGLPILHRAEKGFGSTLEDGRMSQTFFFQSTR